MEIFFSDLGILVEADAFDPDRSLSRPDLNARENDVTESPSAAEEDFRVVSQVAGQDELIDHRNRLLSLWSIWFGVKRECDSVGYR
jgi:hypothetical protein